MKGRDLTETALLTALICLLSPWTVPVGSLPVTLGSMAVCLACGVAGRKGVTASVLYILLGMVGLPVFAGFQGGVHMLISPTVGYILGYIPLGLCMAFAAKVGRKTASLILGQAVGYILLYAVGTVGYCLVTKTSVAAAIAVTALPFIIGDILKIIFVGIITPRICRHLR